ncbi:MAG: thioredoxin domain-containing protein [Bifidobacteriaceae bacterium]|jgi:protein-disulfide isomerase|nr:thioredoxin domain-containing protein [Bifidobacteriaceae bacterium]
MAKYPKKPPVAAARERARQEARLEAERLKAAQAAKDRRRRLISVAIGAAVVVVAAIVVILVLQTTKTPGFAELTKPPGATERGSIVIGQDLKPGGEPASGDDVLVLRIYSDYMCSACGSTERRLGARVEELAASGEVQLEINSLGFLDDVSTGTAYSSTAANAVATVAEYAPDQYLAFHSKLFEQEVQTVSFSEGLTNERLAELAAEVGVPQDVTDRFALGEFNDWVAYTTDQALNDGVGQTPAIAIGKTDSSVKFAEYASSLDVDSALARVRAGDSPD